MTPTSQRLHTIGFNQARPWRQNQLIAESSSIGLTPGDWPTHIRLTGSVSPWVDTTYIRNEFHRDAEGDLEYVVYCALDGRQLIVLND